LLAGSGISLADDEIKAAESASAANANSKPDFRVRADVFLKKLVSPQAFLETVPGTLFDHARNFPEDWGRGPDAFGMRFGSQYGQFVISELIVSGVSALHHEDPRYFASTDKGIWKRTKHAVGTAFVCRSSSGGRTVALSMPAGVFGAWAVATQWSPPDVQGPVEILKWGSFGMLMKVGGNVLHEFWPDAKRMLLHRHAEATRNHRAAQTMRYWSSVASLTSTPRPGPSGTSR